jgi:hypothetical protein
MAVPPQRAPDVLGQSILDFLAQCRQTETDSREALVAHHEECHRYWAENMRNGGSPPAHLSSYTAFALKKDFYRHWEEAELDNELIDRHRHDKATRAMAIEVGWLRLKEEVRIGINKDLNLVLLRAKAFDDERLRLLAEERPQTTESAELVLAEVSCCHDAGTYIAMSTESSRADERHRHKAAAQAAESAVLLLAEDRRRHEAPELATPMRSLAASQDCADIEAIAYEAPALPTTTSPEPPAMLSPSPRPTSSYLGTVLNTNGGGESIVAFNVA